MQVPTEAKGVDPRELGLSACEPTDVWERLSLGSLKRVARSSLLSHFSSSRGLHLYEVTIMRLVGKPDVNLDISKFLLPSECRLPMPQVMRDTA